MNFFNFIKTAGEKLGIIEGDHQNSHESLLQKMLDHYTTGSDKVHVKLDNDHATLSGNVEDHSALEKAILTVGNSLGISTVDAKDVQVKNPASVEKKSQFYEVKKGDTLWKIAENFYGSGHGQKDKAIFEANRPMLSSPDKIYPGQVLRIPQLA